MDHLLVSVCKCTLSTNVSLSDALQKMHTIKVHIFNRMLLVPVSFPSILDQLCVTLQDKKWNWFADLLIVYSVIVVGPAKKIRCDYCDHSCSCEWLQGLINCSIAGNCQVQLKRKVIHCLKERVLSSDHLMCTCALYVFLNCLNFQCL